MELPRRHFILGGAAAALTIPVAARLPITLNQTIGPFYPVERMLDQDADLTIVRGRRGRPRGQVIEVMGRVLDPDGRPLGGAMLDLWQANADGRYAHPGDTNPAPLDPDFQGSTRLTADAEGRYRFRTVRPGLYPGRVAHIHLDVTGGTQRIITQMYFPDDPGNDKDVLLARIPAGPMRQAMVARMVAGTSVPTLEWDIVLGAG
jgi:protocatechuate 3,4-dioxygenase beta subunit